MLWMATLSFQGHAATISAGIVKASPFNTRASVPLE